MCCSSLLELEPCAETYALLLAEAYRASENIGEGEDDDVDQLHGASDPKPGFDSTRTALIADRTQGGVQGLSRLARGEVGEELGFHVACVVGRETEGNHRKAIDEHGDADGRV